MCGCGIVSKRHLAWWNSSQLLKYKIPGSPDAESRVWHLVIWNSLYEKGGGTVTAENAANRWS